MLSYGEKRMEICNSQEGVMHASYKKTTVHICTVVLFYAFRKIMQNKLDY